MYGVSLAFGNGFVAWLSDALENTKHSNISYLMPFYTCLFPNLEFSSYPEKCQFELRLESRVGLANTCRILLWNHDPSKTTSHLST